MSRCRDEAAGRQGYRATINTTGSLVMQSERVGSQTMLSQIVQMVAHGAAVQGSDAAAWPTRSPAGSCSW